MKKIILMFVVLITGIANAQTFDFGCTSAEVRTNRTDQLAALVGQHNVTSMTHFESDPGSTPVYVGASYVQNGSPFTFGLSTSVGLIEDITDWSTKYSELVAKLIADSGIEPTTHAHRAGVLTSYNSIDGISNIEVKVDNPINLSVATVYLEWDLNGVAQDTYYFSATNPTVDSNGQVPGDLSYYEPGQFETNRERLYNKLIAHIPVGSTYKTELAAIFASDTPPTELTGLVYDEAHRLASTTDFTPKRNLFTVDLTGEGIDVTIQTTPNAFVVTGPDETVVVEYVFNFTNGNPSSYRDLFFEVLLTKWNVLYPNYEAPTPFQEELTAIYAADTAPTGFVSGGLIETAASGFTSGSGSSDKIAFLESLDSENHIVHITNANNPSKSFLSHSNAPTTTIETITSSIAKYPYEYDSNDALTFALEIVQAIWDLNNPEAALRAERIADLEGLGNTNVTVEVDGDTVNVIQGTSTQHINIGNYGNNNGVLEDLDPTAYGELKTAVIAKRNELTPTVAKELAAWFADTDNAPTGAAPDYLPTALYAKANTLSNGTERFNFIRNELLSAHGVTITNGGAGGTGATVTTFILSSPNSEYDVIFDWGSYSTNGFNGSNASPELYRNLVFDIIKAGWKLVNETHNTKRSDWLDQDLDITGNDVELQTYGGPNFDWWIYFNVDGLRIPILSGGIASDPMFYNKHTVNPHDTYMTEVEFQTLVTFVTYMRDNFDRLKAINGTFNRNIEISNLTDEFGVGISVTNDGGSYHYTFSKNGNSNEYPVQSNWTHAAGTTLGQLNPDSWVKFYAKCRGIILGL